MKSTFCWWIDSSCEFNIAFLMSRFWVKFRNWLFNLPIFGDSCSHLFIYMPFTSIKSPFKPDLMVRPGVFTIFHGISWWHKSLFSGCHHVPSAQVHAWGGCAELIFVPRFTASSTPSPSLGAGCADDPHRPWALAVWGSFLCEFVNFFVQKKWNS